MRLLVRATCALLLLLVATPAYASAASVSLTPPGEVIAELAFPVAVQGVAAEGETLDVGYASPGGVCLGPRFEDELIPNAPVRGPFRNDVRASFEEPGQYVICAYVSNASRDVVAHASLPIAARPPRAALAISATPVVARGHRLEVTVTGTAEAPRAVVTTLARPGAACPANDLFVVFTNVGAGAFTQRGSQTPNAFGNWRICVEVKRRSSSSDVNDQRFERPFRVSVSCTRATLRLSRARGRWRSRSRALALAGRPPDARLRRFGRAIRRARARVAPACRPGLR